MQDQGTTGFGFFTRLPAELRYYIWEMTWPEAYVIEAAYVEPPDDYDPEITEVVILRKTSRLSTWLQHDFGSRILEDSPLEKCQAPVTLQVCQESRGMTLQKLARLQHAHLPDHVFYFRPGWDILWLSTDVTDNPDCQEVLRQHYGPCLDSIERMLMEEHEWAFPGTYPKCLAMFRGLQCVQLLQGKKTSQQEAESDNEEMQGERGWTIQYLDQTV